MNGVFYSGSTVLTHINLKELLNLKINNKKPHTFLKGLYNSQ